MQTTKYIPKKPSRYSILYYETLIRLYNTANTAILYGHKIVRRPEAL